MLYNNTAVQRLRIKKMMCFQRQLAITHAHSHMHKPLRSAKQPHLP